MAKKGRKRTQRSKEHQRRVMELRSSNAAGFHGTNKYSRKVKHKTDYKED